MERMNKVGEIKQEFHRKLENLGSGVCTKELIQETNVLILEQLGVSQDDFVNCVICNGKVGIVNVAKDETGLIEPDRDGNLWCQPCLDKHDSVDWSEWGMIMMSEKQEGFDKEILEAEPFSQLILSSFARGLSLGEIKKELESNKK